MAPFDAFPTATLSSLSFSTNLPKLNKKLPLKEIENNKHSYMGFIRSDERDYDLEETIQTTQIPKRLKSFWLTTPIPLYRRKYLDGLSTTINQQHNRNNDKTRSNRPDENLIRYVDEETIQSPFDQLGYFSDLNKAVKTSKEV